MIYLKFVLVLFFVTLTACQSVPTGGQLAAQQVSILHTPGSEQSTYIKENGSVARFCTETDTDVEQTKTGGYNLGVAGYEIGDEKSSGAVTLGGRDPTVLITRELMFRACELILNTNIKAPDAVKVYAGTLDALIKIVALHKGKGTKSVDDKPVVHPMFFGGHKSNGANKEGSNSNSVSKDFNSGFSWDDYSDSSTNIDPSHP